jgi:DNA-binding transcriptional LysR family regulator
MSIVAVVMGPSLAESDEGYIFATIVACDPQVGDTTFRNCNAMEDLNDLALLVKVIDAGGFTAAQRATGIPKSRLSRRIAALEARLGAQLLHRSAHSFAVTPLGETVYRRARAMVEEADAAAAAARAAMAEPSGVVRINTSVLFGERVLAVLLAEFACAHPKVTIALSLTDRFVDLVAERFDLAIRFAGAPLESSDVIARPIGLSPVVLVASPALLAQVPAPETPQELPRDRCLGMGAPEQVRPWLFRAPDGAAVEIAFRPRFMSDSMMALRQAALAGLGFAQIPRSACFREIERGELVELLPDWAPPPATAYAVYPSRRGVTSAVRHIIDFLRRRLGPDNEMYRQLV